MYIKSYIIKYVNILINFNNAINLFIFLNNTIRLILVQHHGSKWKLLSYYILVVMMML